MTLKLKSTNYQKEFENLQEKSIHLNHLLNEAAIVSETDANGDIIYVNEKFCKISGYLKEELIGKNHRILKSGLQPQGLFIGMWAAISKGRVWHGEVCNKRKDGTFYWVITTIYPYKNSQGKIEKYGTIRFEITPLKELEKHLKQRTYELTTINKKLKKAYNELELFSYSVSHDLRSPLRALQGFSKNLQKKYGNTMDETANRWIKFIETNAERMDKLICDLLDFSRISRTEIKKQQTSMNNLVSKIFQQERKFYKQPIEFSKGDLPIVWGDNNMLELVWQNLISNALKYSGNKKKIEIQITGNESKTHCHYIITDNGAGFDMRYYDKLFNLFQRLHGNDEFSGTGIGLANASSIVNRHGGKIWAEAELEKGAKFEFTIPKLK